MIAAIDINVLLDVLIPSAPHGEESERALAEAVGAGALVISESVYAELAVNFPDRMDLDRFLADTGIRLEPSGGEAMHRAGSAWSEYLRRRPATLACPQCGAPQEERCDRCSASIHPRQHVVADFVIGAHALVHADRLLTRQGLLRHILPRVGAGVTDEHASRGQGAVKAKAAPGNTA